MVYQVEILETLGKEIQSLFKDIDVRVTGTLDDTVLSIDNRIYVKALGDTGFTVYGSSKYVVLPVDFLFENEPDVFPVLLATVLQCIDGEVRL